MVNSHQTQGPTCEMALKTKQTVADQGHPIHR